ncbi:MAG: M15 family metallopeptidase [Colwellia sp.]|nr:M15 family metallopeptidase [Colwellia sp.]
MKSAQIITNDIFAQVLGLTDQHIHYFETPTNTKTLGIHRLMLTDFQALVTSAAKADIEIKIASGFRSFERQLVIWNNKFTGKTAIKNSGGEQVNITELNEDEIVAAIMLYSALPGVSRHHWGCDIDIYAANLLAGKPLQLEPWEYESSGPMAKLSTWLDHNAATFGFYFPYDCYRGGIAAEPWHLSYVPLAKQYQAAFSLENLQQCLFNSDLSGKSTILENLPNLVKRFSNNINVCELSLHNRSIQINTDTTGETRG